jgi:hypothetical protein
MTLGILYGMGNHDYDCRFDADLLQEEKVVMMTGKGNFICPPWH